jgi:thiamine-phosphate pyrophosphorylase
MPKPDFRLYLITDRRLGPVEKAAEEALLGGARAMQLREKDLPVRELLDMALRLRDMTKRYGARLFINDRVDVALSVEADGVHLGGQSIPVQAVKRISDKLVIGVSTHSLEDATKAEAEGADFITFGPIYSTPSKAAYGEPVGVERLREVCRAVSVPVFALGGIKADNVEEVLGAGAHGVALISAVFGAADTRKETGRFVRILG